VRKALLTLLFALLAAPSPGLAHSTVAAFYYPWYGTPARDGSYEHWQQGEHAPPVDIASAYYPARGAYSSSNPHLLAAQMHDLATAGVNEIVSSWWGRFSQEDARLPAVIAAARKRGIRVAAHLEPYPGRTREGVSADIDYLRSLGIRDFFVYEAGDFTAEQWRAVNDSLSGVRTFAQTSRVGFAAAAGFTGVYTYDIVAYGGWMFRRFCDEAHAEGILCAPSVGPGFDARTVLPWALSKPRRGGRTYDAMWTAAIAAQADLVTITSYNEWNEGTQIEPAGRGNGPVGYRNYDGTYGLHGTVAEYAYIGRTSYWAAHFRASR
jgi:hypothetical protein